MLYDHKLGSSQQVQASSDQEANDVLNVTIYKQGFLISANSDGSVRLLNMNDFSVACQINLSSSCLCLAKIE
jgi:hypothetical protein